MAFASIARRLAERVTRNWVYRRRLPAAFGGVPLFVTPSAGLKYLIRPMAAIDPALLANAADLIRPNDVIWDIGANVGLFAFAAAARAGAKGRVIAFEPDPFLARLLRQSVAIQPAPSARVSVISAAIAADVSLREFTIASRSRASNAMAGYGQTQMGSVSETQTVVALNLDWLVERLPPPNIVKCDVEGAETEVFTRQDRTLTEIRPIILCEVSRRAEAQMTSLLTESGYVLYDGEKPLAAAAKTKRASWNTIAIPREREFQYVNPAN